MISPPKKESLRPIVYVQLIQTEWTKASRGGESAGKRNQVPEAVKLPPALVSQNHIAFLTQTLIYQEENGFGIPTSVDVELKQSNLFRTNGLRIEYNGDKVSVAYQYDSSHGAPERYSKQQSALTLFPEQWGSIRYNGRFSGYSIEWLYRKWVWNIGWLTLPKANVFLTTDPVHVFSQMAHLF